MCAQAQDDWADWVISEKKAKRMVAEAGAANFKLIDQFEKSRLAKFSKFIKDCAKLSNFLQPTATDNLGRGGADEERDIKARRAHTKCGPEIKRQSEGSATGTAHRRGRAKGRRGVSVFQKAC